MYRLAAAALLALPLSAFAADSYTIDPYHTFPGFTIDHLGISTMYGRFDKTTGKATLDRAAKSGSLDLTIEANSITTGDNDKGSRPRSRDEHLRSPDFFNVAEFPTMTFKSTRVVFKGDNPATLEGNITLLGVTKPVSFTIDRWRCMTHPQSKKDICGGNASGTIKRSDFGMKFAIPGVGDEQQLYIEMEAIKD